MCQSLLLNNSRTIKSLPSILQISKAPEIVSVTSPKTAQKMSTSDLAPLDFSPFYNVVGGDLTVTATTRHGINPLPEGSNPEVPVSTPADVEAAVSDAKAAFPGWAATT